MNDWHDYPATYNLDIDALDRFEKVKAEYDKKQEANMHTLKAENERLQKEVDLLKMHPQDQLIKIMALEVINADLLEALETMLNVETAARIGSEAKALEGFDYKYHFDKAREAIRKARGDNG